jgi:hypothetical protein
MKITIATYKYTKWKDKYSFLNKAISIRTLSRHVHSEVIVDGVWHSFSMEGYRAITREKYNKENWLLIELDVDKKDYDRVKKNIEEIKNDNDGYDYMNILLFQALKSLGSLLNKITGKKLDNKKKRICSEFVSEVFIGTIIKEKILRRPPSKTAPADIVNDLSTGNILKIGRIK